jgi:hypothetical protein
MNAKFILKYLNSPPPPLHITMMVKKKSNVCCYKSDILDFKCTSCFIFFWTTGRDSEKKKKRDGWALNFTSKISVGEAFMGRLRNLYTVLMGKTEGKRKHGRGRCNP